MSKKQIWLRVDQVSTLETCLIFIRDAHKRKLGGLTHIDELAHTIALAAVNELLEIVQKNNHPTQPKGQP